MTEAQNEEGPEPETTVDKATVAVPDPEQKDFIKVPKSLSVA
jgi:hypothetical protein